MKKTTNRDSLPFSLAKCLCRWIGLLVLDGGSARTEPTCSTSYLLM